ncbi:MAG: tetratricopeptide repeat protein, partial [Methanococcaceae archaeon]
MHKNNVVFILAGAFIILISGCAGSDYYQGKKNLDLGNYGKAIEYFNQEIQLQPNNFKAHRDLGIALYKKNDLSNSLVSLQKAFSIKKNDAFTIFYLGLINEAMKDYDQALNYYKEYINLGLFDEGIKDVIDGRIQWIANK